MLYSKQGPLAARIVQKMLKKEFKEKERKHKRAAGDERILERELRRRQQHKFKSLSNYTNILICQIFSHLYEMFQVVYAQFE